MFYEQHTRSSLFIKFPPGGSFVLRSTLERIDRINNFGNERPVKVLALGLDFAKSSSDKRGLN